MAELPLNLRLELLLRRRRELIGQCNVQRATLTQCAVDLERPARIVDRVVGVAAYLRANPVVVLGVTAAAMLLRRGKLSGWVSRGVSLWRLARSLTRIATLWRR